MDISDERHPSFKGLRWNSDREKSVDKCGQKLRPLEPRNLALTADPELEAAWRVEYVDSDGHGYTTIFAGQSAELRARDYYDAIERGVLNTRTQLRQARAPQASNRA